MTENAILLILGILFIMAFFGIAAIVCFILEFFFPNQIEKLDEWLGIPTDDWETPNY